MENVHTMWSVNVITIRPKSCSPIELLPIKDTRCVRINWYFELGMTFAEAQSSSPNRIGEFWLRQVASAFGGMCSNLARKGDHA